MPKKIKNKKPDVHEDLSNFDIRINSFGELESSLSIDKINTFLNEKKDSSEIKEEE